MTSHANTISTQSAHVHAAPLATANVKLLCALVFMMGAGMVFLVGFSQTSVVHNAAHDTRHGLAFPCH
jgi:cobalt transporter subunit CbtB